MRHAADSAFAPSVPSASLSAAGTLRRHGLATVAAAAVAAIAGLAAGAAQAQQGKEVKLGYALAVNSHYGAAAQAWA
ncbi:hypothetical protein, partial [Corallococcus exiguus]|uniref:hypothetical protein n=2 Tax=Pseudomonadati TaxID=3379134 RepID=UPI001C26D6B0